MTAAAGYQTPPALHPDSLANAVPEVIYHQLGPQHPHRIQPHWVRTKPDGKYQLKLTQPAASPRFHADGSPCFRPEVCPQGSVPALTLAVQWLTDKEDWRLTRRRRPTPEGGAECRLQPPAGWL